MSGLATLIGARMTMSWNSLRSLQRHSRFKIFVILFFAMGLWGGFFWLFLDGFRFLDRSGMGDFRGLLVGIMFSVFFFSLFIMLLFSNGIIAYGSLFRSSEAAELFTRPLPSWNVFAYKLWETLLFSSWAFLFLALPLIVAYGVADKAPWYYYPGATLFFAVFALVPAALGGIITLIIARFFTNSPKRILVVAIFIALALAHVWGLGLADAYHTGARQAGTAWVRSVIGRLMLSQSPMLPSYWISSGIQHLAQGQLHESGYRFLLLLSTALFGGMAGIHLARGVYTSGYHRIQSCSKKRKRQGERWIYRIGERLLVGIKPELRILVIKDLKTFLRDPVQWSQVLIFFGLLAVYFINMRSVQGNIDAPMWNNLINLLNLVATSLTLSTFTSRFVFPLVSLEGRRFWILGLLPIERKNLIYSKFWFAFVGSFAISQGLIAMSDLVLSVPWNVRVLHSLTVLVICAGLSGLSVGLGAIYPNLRESNPSKIVSGFGGTLNLVLSLIFVVLTIGLMAMPYHLSQMGRLGTGTALGGMMMVGSIAAVGLGAVTTLLPLWLGVRAFERLET